MAATKSVRVYLKDGVEAKVSPDGAAIMKLNKDGSPDCEVFLEPDVVATVHETLKARTNPKLLMGAALMRRLRVVPVELSEANALVSRWHRHHQPAQGHRFSLGVITEDGSFHGAAIVGRPVARLAGPPREVLEVVRLVTDGTPNACSALYAAAARAGKAMGFVRIQTYVLEQENGASLRASGWVDEGLAGGGSWKHTDGMPRRTDQPIGMKRRYTAILNAPLPPLDCAVFCLDSLMASLFDESAS